MEMDTGGDGITRWRRGFRPWLSLALALVMACALSSLFAGSAHAQFFSDHGPPIPPASVPQSLPPALAHPSISTVPPATPPGGAPGQAVLALSARYGKDMPVINGGLVWRIFSDRPDENGTFKMIREDRNATPNIVLPPGNYVVDVAFGLVTAVRTVTLKAETDRESFTLPAGGLRIEGRVGASKIPQNQISFAIYKGSQFEGGDRSAMVPTVAAG